MNTIFLLLTLSNFCNFAQASHCYESFVALQKKLIAQHIYKYPLNYGKDIEVLSVDSSECHNDLSNRYTVHYTDTVCFDGVNTDRSIIKCSQVRCRGTAQISVSGIVDFQTASIKSCQKIK